MTDPFPIRGELAFDAARIYFGDTVHIEIRRSKYLGRQAWKWDNNYKLEFTLDGGTMLVEYTDEARWRSVLAELEKLPLTGE